MQNKLQTFNKTEIKNLEKIALREEREDYRPIEERLEKIKEKLDIIKIEIINNFKKCLNISLYFSIPKSF